MWMCNPLTGWTVLKKHDDILAFYVISIRSFPTGKHKNPFIRIITHYGQVTSYGDTDLCFINGFINIYWGIGLLSHSTRPLHELMIICHHINWGGSRRIRFSTSLKNRIRQDVNFVGIGSTRYHRNDNLRCHQWRQRWHHTSYQFSVTEIPFHFIWDRFSYSSRITMDT